MQLDELEKILVTASTVTSQRPFSYAHAATLMAKFLLDNQVEIRKLIGRKVPTMPFLPVDFKE